MLGQHSETMGCDSSHRETAIRSTVIQNRDPDQMPYAALNLPNRSSKYSFLGHCVLDRGLISAESCSF